MGWEISETSLSPTYVDDPIEYWYSNDVDEHRFGNNFPCLGTVTAAVLKAFDEAAEYIAADMEMGPMTSEQVEKEYADVAKQVLHEYGLYADVYMSELRRRVSESWIYRSGLDALDN